MAGEALMNDQQLRARLGELRVDQLADALMALAQTNATARDTVLRMTTGKSASIVRYQAKLHALATARRFVTWQGVPAFCEELEQLLLDLQAGVEDADTGFDLIAAFFEADSVIFEHCDDSSGWVGDLFYGTAADLLAKYGAECADPSRVVARLVALYADDNYGIRDVVIDAAHRFLATTSLRALAAELQERARHAGSNKSTAWHWLQGLASIARQLHDAPLFEQAQRAMYPDLPASAHLDIAAVYFEAGDAATARAWLELIPDQHHHAVERDALLLKVLRTLGETEAAAQVAWQAFTAYHNVGTLQTLLGIIGEHERDRVLDETTTLILQSERFSNSDATFLTDIGRITDAETYILHHVEQWDGAAYFSLGPLAECMERENRWLAASVLYRALTASILKRGVSKYYHHGVHYLAKLDILAPKINDWSPYASHTEFVESLRYEHGRKTSFWAKYTGSR